MRKTGKLVLLLVIMPVLACSQAQLIGSDSPTEWSAQWIGPEDGGAENLWLSYRKNFDLSDKPDSAPAQIAVDSKYWLWVNGKMAVREGGLKRGPTPQDSYYDQLDLAKYLRKGNNTIAVLVWHFGKDGFAHNDSGKAGLIFEMTAGQTKVLSDDSWRVLEHPAYSSTEEGPEPNYRLAESNISFDAREDIPNWYLPGFDDSNWQAPAQFGGASSEPWGQLAKRPIGQWKDYGLAEYQNSDEIPARSNGGRIICKLPYNAQITPYLKVKAPAGKKIDIRTDHYHGGGPPNVRAVYITRAGVQEYESPGWMNGHKVYYTIPAGVEVLSLKFRQSGYDTEFTGHFECSDDFYNRLVKKAVRTLYVTMRDNYMDCPDRERAQWWGDEAIELGEAFYALDLKSHALAKKGIRELVNWQRDNGVLYSPVPQGNWKKELPTQMLASIGRYGFWNYYLYTGDAETIKYAYPAVKRYLDLWELQDNGLVKMRPGEWTWGDWGENQDMPLLYNGWYFMALRAAAQMAELAGRDEDIQGYRQKADRLAESFNRELWTGEFYRSANHQGPPDDRGNALAVVTGLVRPEKFERIRKVLNEQYYASPYMEKYVLEALFQMGYATDALERMKKRYGDIVASEYTTLPEQFHQGKNNTHNHAWSGGPLTLLYSYVAGVVPSKPGFESFWVRPHLGGLRHISAGFETVKGRIEVDLENTNGVFTAAVLVPNSTSATVWIPAGDDDQTIKANGQIIWQRGQAHNGVEGVTYTEPPGEYYPFEEYRMFEVGPGRWKFTAQKEQHR